jgi:segregation and condensation protein A
MLLPRPSHVADDEEDPRAELVRRLLEYERMKLAAQKINELPQSGRDFSPVSIWFEKTTTEILPDVDPDDLRNAWLGLLARAQVKRHHRISREELFVQFDELFEPERGVPVLVVTFLAILELAKETMVQLSQQGVFSPIYVKLTHGLTAV